MTATGTAKETLYPNKHLNHTGRIMKAFAHSL